MTLGNKHTYVILTDNVFSSKCRVRYIFSSQREALQKIIEKHSIKVTHKESAYSTFHTTLKISIAVRAYIERFPTLHIKLSNS